MDLLILEVFKYWIGWDEMTCPSDQVLVFIYVTISEFLISCAACVVVLSSKY